MNIERLETLAARLEAPLAAFHFNIGIWLKKRDCNTSGCAVGLALIMPEFVAAGLKPALDFELSGRTAYVPTFGELKGWFAVHAFFDLKDSEAEELFSDEAYMDEQFEDEETMRVTPGMVAKRIREYIAAERLAHG